MSQEEALSTCFAPGGVNPGYTIGSWVPFSQRRYKISADLWGEIGTAIKGNTPQHYGRCDKAMPNRTLYEWKPHGCTLERFDEPALCETMRGRSLLMVGDSTVFQLWLSFALLLGSHLGKNIKRASTVSEITASACGDSTRLAFVRNDLLLYSTSGGDFTSAKRCDGFMSIQNFVVRAARDADVVILGVGHHFPGSLDMALKYHEPHPSATARLQYHAFLPFSLNHTLSLLIAARAAWGHADAASSVLLVGTSTPVAGCSRFSHPISLAQYAAANYEHRRTVDSPMWLSYSRMNLAASYVAEGAGVHFLDLAKPSAQRPDGAMARYWSDAGKVKEDCVHYCMPGPVDAWSTLVYNWIVHGKGGLASSSARLSADSASASIISASPLVALGGRAAARQVRLNGTGRLPRRHYLLGLNQSSSRARSRFFKLNLTRWLSERGASTWMEKCSSATCWTPRLSRQWWWPFNCSGPH